MTRASDLHEWARAESRARVAWAVANWVQPAEVGRCARCPTLLIRYGQSAHGTVCLPCREHLAELARQARR